MPSGPEKETKYVVLGEKGKVQLVRDSKNSIEMNITELQKNPLNYTQVSSMYGSDFFSDKIELLIKKKSYESDVNEKDSWINC